MNADLLKQIMRRVFLCFLVVCVAFLTPEMAMAQVIGGQNAADIAPGSRVVQTDIFEEPTDLLSPSFSELAPTTEGGFFAVPTEYQQQVREQLGYDPSRAWPEGATPDEIIKLGDLLNSEYLKPIGQLSLRQIAQLSGTKIEQISLNQISVIRELSVGDLYQLYPDLRNVPLAQVPFLRDTFSTLINSPHPLIFDETSNNVLSELIQHPVLHGQTLEELARGNWLGVIEPKLQQQIRELASQLPAHLSQLPIERTFPLINGSVGNWFDIIETAIELGTNLTGEQLLNQIPLLEKLPLGILPINNLSVNSLPGIVDKALDKIPNVGNIFVQKIPGFSNIPINQFPIEFAKKLLSTDTFARLDTAYAGAVENPVINVVTGGTKDQKFKPSPCQEKRCPHFELDDVIGSGAASPMSGQSWVEGKAQLVDGGKGFLRSLNNGKEPTGIPVWGIDAHVKLSLEDIKEGRNGTPSTARVWANFQYCISTFFGGENCTPHFIPVPTPWFVKEGGLVVIASTSQVPDFIATERDRVQRQQDQQYGQNVDDGDYSSDLMGDDCVQKAIAAVPGNIRANARNSIALIFSEAKKAGLSKNQLAYVLATTEHETGNFLPIKEGDYLGGGAENFRRTLRYYPYYGRGFVQLTWKSNYQYWSRRLGIDLVNNKDLALRPDIAAKILVYGMRDGTFTGRKLRQYVNNSKTDFNNARRVVNGTDRASLIAGYARRYQKALKGCSSGTGTTGSNVAVGTANKKILQAIERVGNFSTARMPGTNGGKYACMGAVNKVIQAAGFKPLDGLSVLEAEKELKRGRGTRIELSQTQPGDILIVADDERPGGRQHVGVCLNVGCTKVKSNSSSRASFSWISDGKFSPSYRGNRITHYRLKR